MLKEIIQELSSGKTITAPIRQACVSHAGKDLFIAPIVDETSHGFILSTGVDIGSPATEWFAFRSERGTCREITPRID